MNFENKLFNIKNLLIGLAAAFGSMFGLLLIMALLMTVSDMPSSLSGTLASVALIFGGVTGGFFVSKIQGENGILVGAILGFILFVIITIISLVIDFDRISTNTLIHFIITVLSGALGGIIGVNTANKRKF